MKKYMTLAVIYFALTSCTDPDVTYVQLIDETEEVEETETTEEEDSDEPMGTEIEGSEDEDTDTGDGPEDTDSVVVDVDSETDEETETVDTDTGEEDEEVYVCRLYWDMPLSYRSCLECRGYNCNENLIENIVCASGEYSNDPCPLESAIGYCKSNDPGQENRGYSYDGEVDEGKYACELLGDTWVSLMNVDTEEEDTGTEDEDTDIENEVPYTCKKQSIEYPEIFSCIEFRGSAYSYDYLEKGLCDGGRYYTTTITHDYCSVEGAAGYCLTQGDGYDIRVFNYSPGGVKESCEMWGDTWVPLN